MKTLAAAVIALSMLDACSLYAPPRAWEKGSLARPEMTMAADPLEQRLRQHVYSSKEDASGGYGSGGGGCGCN